LGLLAQTVQRTPPGQSPVGCADAVSASAAGSRALRLGLLAQTVQRTPPGQSPVGCADAVSVQD